MQEWEDEAQAAVARAQAALERAEAAAEAHAARAAEAHAACAVAEHTPTTTAIQAPLTELESPEMLASLASWLGGARRMVTAASEMLLQLANARAALNEVAAEERRGWIIAGAREAEGYANGAWQFITSLAVSGGASE